MTIQHPHRPAGANKANTDPTSDEVAMAEQKHKILDFLASYGQWQAFQAQVNAKAAFSPQDQAVIHEILGEDVELAAAKVILENDLAKKAEQLSEAEIEKAAAVGAISLPQWHEALMALRMIELSSSRALSQSQDLERD